MFQQATFTFLFAALISLGVSVKSYAQSLTDPPKLLVIYCSGGWDPSMVFDPHVGESTVAQESGASIVTSTSGISYVSHSNRPSVTNYFDTYGDKSVVINGLYTGDVIYEKALETMYGGTPKKHSLPVDWLTYYTAYLNSVAEMPSVFIEAPYMPGEYNDHTVRLTSNLLSEYADGLPSTDLSDTAQSALEDWQEAAFDSITDGISTKSRDYEKLSAIATAYARETRMSETLSEVLDDLGAQGSDSDLLRHGKLALELFSRGKSQAIAIQAGRHLAWDTRKDHFSSQSALYESLFSDLNQILAYGDQLDLLSNIIVMVMSERGREPLLNDNDGKGPWPYTSLMIYSPYFAGGQTLGQTDESMRGLDIHPLFGSIVESGGSPLTIHNVMAGVFLKTGVPGTLILPKDTQVLAALIATEDDDED